MRSRSDERVSRIWGRSPSTGYPSNDRGTQIRGAQHVAQHVRNIEILLRLGPRGAQHVAQHPPIGG